MTTKVIPTPEKRKRAVRGSVGYAIHVWLPGEVEQRIKEAAKTSGAPSISEWVRRLIYLELFKPD